MPDARPDRGQLDSSTTAARRWLAPGALVVSMMLWGSTHPAVKLALRELDASQVIYLRVLSAAVFLIALTLLTGRGVSLVAQLRAPLVPLVQALLGFFITMNLSTRALEYLPAAVNALLINLSPIFTVLLGSLILGEALGRRSIVGIVVGFLGVGVVTLSGQELGGLGPGALPGVGIGLLAALVWASFTVAIRRLAHATVDPIAATALAALGAIVPLGVIAGPLTSIQVLAAASPSVQAAILWTGAVSTGGTYVIWAWALSRMGAGRVAAFQYLVAPMALVLAWPILDEVPSPLLIVGMGLVLAGVAAAQRR